MGISGYTGLILILAYLFYYLRKVNISLTYYWQQTIPVSFTDALKTPGGISELVADLILEYTSHPLLGSAMMAILLVIVFISLKTIFRRYSSNLFFYALILAALIPLFLMFNHYRLPFGLVTGLVAGLLLGMFHSYFLSRNLLAGALFNFFAGILVYMIAGVPGLLVLLQVIMIQLLISKRYVALVTILPLLTIPLLYLPFNPAISVKQALLGSILVSEYDEIPLEFFFSLASPMLLFMLFSMLNFVFSKFSMKNSFLISGGSIIVVMAGLVYFTLDNLNERERNSYEIVQASFNGEWDKIILLTREASFINNLIQFEVNRALFETGQLLDEMFSYPQQFAEKGIFLDEVSSSQVAVHTAAFYYDLGFANEARHWATEAQMVMVRHPIVLKQLVMSYIAIGQEETALKYLRVLSESRLYREWCDHVYMMLENNQSDDDPEISFLRANNPSVDFFAGTKYPVQKLKIFYRSTKNNNMAFEFLIASYLLQHNIGTVVFMLPEFKDHGFEQLPRAVEEALMIYLAKGGDGSLLSGYSVRSSTLEKFKDFNNLTASAGSRAERMQRVSKYKNTYWYYILFSSPYATKK